MTHRDRFDPPPPWTGAGVALATLLAVLAAYLVAAWLDCSASPGVELCMLALGVPLPPTPTWWLRLSLRIARRGVRRCATAQLRQAGRRIEREACVIELERRLRDRGLKP